MLYVHLFWLTNQPTFSYFSFNRDFFPFILCQLDQLLLYPHFPRCSLRSTYFWPDACTTGQSWNNKASFTHLQFWYIKSCKPTTLFTSEYIFGGLTFICIWMSYRSSCSLECNWIMPPSPKQLLLLWQIFQVILSPTMFP